MQKEEKHTRRKYLKDMIVKMTSIKSPSGCEKRIKKAIKGILFEKSIKCQSGEWGVYTIIPAKNKEIRRVLICCHLDTVQCKMVKPTFLDDERETIVATGLDDRVMVAIALSMINFVHYENTTVVYYFSTEEECGSHGATVFANDPEIHKSIGNIDCICILDVCRGCFSGSIEEHSVIGKGFTPFWQNEPWERRRSVTDLRAFRGSDLYKKIPMIAFGVPCLHMHEEESFCSFKDAYQLFKHLHQEWIYEI